MATFIFIFVSCQQKQVQDVNTTDGTPIGVADYATNNTAVFTDASPIQDASAQETVVITDVSGDTDFEASLEPDFSENNFKAITKLEILSGTEEGKLDERVLLNSEGYVVFYTFDSSNLTEPYKIWRHDQTTNLRIVVYAGTRAVQSVAISLDGNIVSAVMDRSSSDASQDVFSFNISAVTSEQLTTTAEDEVDVSMSGDGTIIAWQGTNTANSNKSIFYRVSSGGSTTDFMLSRSYDMLEPSITQNGKQIVFKFINPGTNYSDSLDRQIAFVYNIDRNKLTKLLTLSDAFYSPSLSDDGSKILMAVDVGGGQYSFKRYDLVDRLWKALRVQSTLVHVHMTGDGSFAVYGRKNATGPIYTDVREIDTDTSAITDMHADTNAHYWQKPSTLPFSATYDSTPAIGATLNLGNIEFLDESALQTIDVSNSGGSDLNINAIITGTHAEDFRFSPSTSQTILSANSSSNGFSLSCRPSGIGTRTAKLVVYTNDISNLRIEYPLTCEGIIPNVVSAGAHHTCKSLNDGTADCWGYAAGGPIGDGTTTDQLSPVAVLTGAKPAAEKWIGFSAGNGHSCGVTDSGAAYCWGHDGAGQLGATTTANQTSPVAVADGAKAASEKWLQLSAGFRHSCGISDKGAAYCWGNNGNGRLGIGAVSANQESPVEVVNGAKLATEKWYEISVGSDHSCGVTDLGNAYCWGNGANGRLGNNSVAGDQASPVAVVDGAKPSTEKWTSISAGKDHTCAVTDAGSAYCWGSAGAGRLGNGVDTGDQGTAVKVLDGAKPMAETWTSVSSAYEHSCGLSSVGKLYCWGDNSLGRLGEGVESTEAAQSSPVAVAQGANTDDEIYSSLEVGTNHSCAVTPTAKFYCWGFGQFGKIGVDNTTTQLAPTAVLP